VKERKVITVDGLAGSGKSTLARLLAEKLQYVHLNSGLLYRAVGFLALKEKVNAGDEAALAKILPTHRISLDLDTHGHAKVELDGEDITAEVQTPQVSEATSKASQFGATRSALLQLQREAYGQRPMVAEGRDMGTIVFPTAPLKFFVVADEKVRVARRLSQLVEKAKDRSDAVLKKLESQISIEIAERDKRDTERSLAPTLAAKDALTIDNSTETLEKIVQRMFQEARSRGL
jgi:cytidylate kinase